MPTKEAREGETPAGGVRSEIYYKDDKGEPVDKSEATAAEIVEYNAEGEVIARTYGTINQNKPPEVKPSPFRR